MSDFHQRGLISTLHRLQPRPVEAVEEELLGLARETPVGLILPCTLEDFRRPAMAEILRQVREAPYFSRIVISLNRATAGDLPEIRRLIPPDEHFRLLWNDDPALARLFPEAASGKGFNLWTAIGWLLHDGSCHVAVTHDTDILNYSREIPAWLPLPLLRPALGYQLVKGYYPRISGQLFGRVTRLFVGPLLRALVRVGGHHPLLDFLDSFRYPLAGEFAARLDLLGQFSLPSGWDLEMDVLCSAHRTIPPEAVAQIDLGANYEHKHQSANPDRDTDGLTRLASAIGAGLLQNLAAEGAVVTPAFLQALQAAYQKSAREMVRRYRDVALLNGLEFHETQELALVAAFAETLPSQPPVYFPKRLPAWSELRQSRPDLCAAFIAALAQQNQP